jgi:hypothetical protein
MNYVKQLRNINNLSLKRGESRIAKTNWTVSYCWYLLFIFECRTLCVCVCVLTCVPNNLRNISKCHISGCIWCLRYYKFLKWSEQQTVLIWLNAYVTMKESMCINIIRNKNKIICSLHVSVTMIFFLVAIFTSIFGCLICCMKGYTGIQFTF